MFAEFRWRGVEYVVSGGLWAGMVVRRLDGKPMRGVKTLPGTVQTGLSNGLVRAAEAALESAREGARAD